VISGNHVFVQHPLHPTHPSLSLLQKSMYDSYNSTETPLLPNIELNAVCVLCVNGIWYRVQILEKDLNDEKSCLVKFLDFGGYMYAKFENMRQIRSDFMGYPFQASECLLSNIEPIGKYIKTNILKKKNKKQLNNFLIFFYFPNYFQSRLKLVRRS